MPGASAILASCGSRSFRAGNTTTITDGGPVFSNARCVRDDVAIALLFASGTLGCGGGGPVVAAVDRFADAGSGDADQEDASLRSLDVWARGRVATAVDAGPPIDPDAAVDAAPDDGPCGAGVVMCEEAGARGLLVDGPAYGRGVAWVDVDGDGWEDLWQSDTGTGYFGHPRTSALYRNLGDANFEPIDLGIAADDMTANWTGSWGDYDDDGDPDVFLANGGYSQPWHYALYRNDLADLGAFTQVTDDLGFEGVVQRWWSAAFADFDGDSQLDLVATAIRGPLALFRNQGDGTFVEQGHDLGLTDPSGDTKNPVWFDFDLDGDPDLDIAATSAPRLCRNGAGAGFTDVTNARALALDVGAPVFAAAAADFDQDGWEDLYLGRWDDQDYVLRNDAGQGFEAVGREAGLDMAVAPDPTENTMGMTVGGPDGEGWPDVLSGQGRPGEEDPPVVLCNDAVVPVHFHRCSDDFVLGQGAARNHGVVLADPDHDGDTDVFWSLGGHVEHDLASGEDTSELAAFYVNRPAEPPSVAVVHLVGSTSNRSAIGARIDVAAGGQVRHYVLHGMQGFPGQSSDWLPVSLGDEDVGTATITWPSGSVTRVDLSNGDRIEIEE